MTKMSTLFPHRNLRPLTFLIALVTAAIPVFTGCSAVPGVYPEPADTVSALRSAVRDDRRMDFLGTLSLDTLREYEHAVLVAWPEVRDAYGFLAGEARVVSITPEHPITRDQAPPGPPGPWVWPSEGLQAVRVRLAVTHQGREYTEDVLMVREEVRGEGTASDRHVRVGDRFILRERHPNHWRLPPAAEAPVWSWRLLAPYKPYQEGSELARAIAEAHAKPGP